MSAGLGRTLLANVKELFVSRDGRRLQHVGLDGGSLAIGRGSDCDIVVEGEFISRLHARLEAQGEVMALVDVSRNGTFVNGERAEGGQPLTLTSGDRFRIGPYEFLYLESSDDDLTRIGEPAVVSGISLDLASRQAWVEPAHRALDLSKQEFDLLQLLWQRRGQVVSQAEIGKAIWGTSTSGGHELALYDASLVQRLVARLRKRLGEAGEGEDALQNVRGVGYKLQ